MTEGWYKLVGKGGHYICSFILACSVTTCGGEHCGVGGEGVAGPLCLPPDPLYVPHELNVRALVNEGQRVR